VHELSIVGLADPHALQADVWAMVRGDGVDGVGAQARAVVGQPVMDRGGGLRPSGTCGLNCEIYLFLKRGELRSLALPNTRTKQPVVQ